MNHQKWESHSVLNLQPPVALVGALRRPVAHDPDELAVVDTMISLFPLAVGLGAIVMVDLWDGIGRPVVFLPTTIAAGGQMWGSRLRAISVDSALRRLASNDGPLRTGYLAVPIAAPTLAEAVVRNHQFRLHVPSDSPSAYESDTGRFLEQCYVVDERCGSVSKDEMVPVAMLELARRELEELVRLGPSDAGASCL